MDHPNRDRIEYSPRPRAKVQLAEDLWNTRDADRVVLAYTEDTIWRNRSEFLEGREAILACKYQ